MSTKFAAKLGLKALNQRWLFVSLPLPEISERIQGGQVLLDVGVGVFDLTLDDVVDDADLRVLVDAFGDHLGPGKPPNNFLSMED